MLATKSSRSPGVLPEWRVGAADAVVGPSDTPGTLLFLSRTVAGVGAAVLLSCIRGVTSELGNVCMTLLSRDGLFPSREKLRESRSPSLGSHRPLRGVIPVRLSRSWLSRDRLFPLRVVRSVDRYRVVSDPSPPLIYFIYMFCISIRILITM